MTQCIAAMCESAFDAKIVAVTDQMITFDHRDMGTVSADHLALKSDPLHKNWYALYSSNNVHHVPFLLEEMRVEIAKSPGEKSQPEVADIATRVLRQRLEKEIESQVLARHGYTVESFRLRGKRELTTAEHHDLFGKIQNIRLETEFLIFGFDEHGEPHIFTVSDEYSAASHDAYGFACIGSGTAVATSAILLRANRHKFNQHISFPACLYYVCEAKFAAEAVRTVGPSTFASVFQFNKKIRYVDPDDVGPNGEMRKIWERLWLPKRIDPQTKQQVASMVLTGEQFVEKMRNKVATRLASGTSGQAQ